MLRVCRVRRQPLYKPPKKVAEAIAYAASLFSSNAAAEKKKKKKKETTNGSAGGAAVPPRVVSFGDVHGDCDKLLVTLAGSGLIDPKTHAWHARPNTTLVQTGDLVDRGAQDCWVLDTMMRLQREAGAAGNGCKVVVLTGNHESMVREGHQEYISDASRTLYATRGNLDELLSANGVYGRWLRTLPLYHVEHRTVFVHAFLHPRFVDSASGWPPGRINKVWLQQYNKWDAFGGIGVSDVFWDRKWFGSTPMHESDDKLVRQTLQLLDADRMVVGHTPTFVDHPRVHDGIYFMMDMAMSRWMEDRPPHVLDLTPDTIDGVPCPAAVALGLADTPPFYEVCKNGVRARVVQIPCPKFPK